MDVYLLLLAVPILLSGIMQVKAKNPEKIYITVVFVIFGAFMGLRGSSVGSDTAMGEFIFNLEISKPWSQIDLTYPGWSVLCKVIGLLGGNYVVFQLLISGIIIFGIAKFIYRCSSDVVLSSYLFIASYTFCSALNVMRQMCAVSLVLLTILAIQEKKKITPVFLMIAASAIHTTAIASLPICWVFWKVKKDNYKRIVFILLIGALSLYLFYDKVVAIMSLFSTHYSSYLEMDASIGGRTVYVQLVYLFFLVCGYIYGTEESAKYKGVMIISLISVCIGIMGAKNAFFLRINYYYTIFMICALPNALGKAMRNEESLTLATIGTMAIFLVPYLIQLHANYSNVIPYGVFWG